MKNDIQYTKQLTGAILRPPSLGRGGVGLQKGENAHE
jgi:hypothetical protein